MILFENLTFLQIEALISRERLARYLHMAENDQDKAAALYLENLALCARFYELLHWLEIGLRNAMNKALIEEYGQQWHDNPNLYLEPHERQQIDTAKRRLAGNEKPTNTPDIVAAISFGFWVNLFNKPYEDPLWRHTLRKTFACTEQLKRSTVRAKLDRLLKLRNRVAHYEPIMGCQLEQREEDINHVMAWIDPTLAC